MHMSHTTSNWVVIGLVGKIRRLFFQWEQSHIQLKSELTIIAKTSQVYRTGLDIVTLYFGL
jgi:hypothetical protein